MRSSNETLGRVPYLVICAFIAANCISYCVYSRVNYFANWGSAPAFPGSKMGFPFVFYKQSAGLVYDFYWNWAALVGNIAIAVATSWILANRYLKLLPPLWASKNRLVRSGRGELLGILVLLCSSLGLALTSRRIGLWYGIYFVLSAR